MLIWSNWGIPKILRKRNGRKTSIISNTRKASERGLLMWSSLYNSFTLVTVFRIFAKLLATGITKNKLQLRYTVKWELIICTFNFNLHLLSAFCTLYVGFLSSHVDEAMGYTIGVFHAEQNFIFYLACYLQQQWNKRFQKQDSVVYLVRSIYINSFCSSNFSILILSEG